MKKSLHHAQAKSLVMAALAAGLFSLSVDRSLADDIHTSSKGKPGMSYDQHYIDMTLMHHQQGVEMAELAEKRAQDPGVKAFAKKTADDQEKDIEQLEQYRGDLGVAVKSPAISMEKHDQTMMKQMNDDMEKLRAAGESDFDRLFLDTMKKHHKMAVDMSKEAAAKAQRKEVKDFARKTVAKQQAEMEEINKLKAAPGGKAS
jgi:uncharacterized protein (DUF305 family)